MSEPSEPDPQIGFKWTVKTSKAVDPTLIDMSKDTYTRPGSGAERLPDYVRITVSGGRSGAVLRPVDTNPGDESWVVTISDEIFGTDAVLTSLDEADKRAFHRWRLLHRREGRIDLAVVLVGIVATWASGSLALGKILPVIRWPDWALFIVQVLAVVAAAVATFLVFWKAYSAAAPRR
jgi:hypothetical protein